MKAINIKPGHILEGFGEVSEVHVAHRDVANRTARKRSNPAKLPRRMNALVRARLAAAAVEECYIQQPSLVTVVNGSKTMKLAPNAEVTLVEPLKAAA
jgi:hypothetical protein